MIIFVRDNKAVCPSCSGLLTAQQNRYTCIDCGQAYIGTGEGRIEGEVIVKETNERDVDEMIERLLDMDIVGEDNSITFTDEAKQLIHEISEECMKASMIVENKDRADKYGKGLSAENVYVDMLHKIVGAPTSLHMRMSARMLISVIDQKLREGEKAIE